MPMPKSTSLGAILAGGMSRRFGAPKALAEVGGRAIVARVRDALAQVVGDVVLIANEPDLYAHLDLPIRGDDVPGLGAIGGVRKALAWARDERRPGALCIACDMPFVTPELLRLVLSAADEGQADAVVPESGGRRGVEPLCAWYSTACIAAVDGLIAHGRGAAMGALLERVRVARVPLARVARTGDPAVLFLNVNTAEDHWRAHLMASRQSDEPS